MRPRLCVWMIARNEARDVARALRSIADIADRVVLVDTGSTDATVNMARGAIADDRLTVERYTDASSNVGGEWLIDDFSKARNRALELAEASGCDWLLALDADDEVLDPQSIRRGMYLPAYDVFALWYQDGVTRWITHRLWKASLGIRYAGAVHEYPVLGAARCWTLDDCTVRHDAAPHTGGEDSNVRNLRILTRVWESGQHDARTAFYLGTTHKDGGRPSKADEWFTARVVMGPSGHRDEWLFAMLYLARAQRSLGFFDRADATLDYAISEAPNWAEFHMERAFCAYSQQRYSKALGLALTVPTAISATHLWREANMYRDQPLRMASWCYEHLGDPTNALAYAERAATLIVGYDADWTLRIARLRSLVAPPPVAHAPTTIEAVALCRPGAIGDILLTLNLIPALREAHPGMPIYYFCDRRLGAPAALGATMHAAGVDMIADAAQWPAWRGRFAKAVDLVGYPLAEGYPENPMKRHLLTYFAAEMGLEMAGLPELALRRPQRPAWAPAGPYATLQNRAGWSRYKEWIGGRWVAVADALAADGVPLLRLDEADAHPLGEVIAAFANAAMHIGLDSFANHLTHYLWTTARGGRRVRGVIVWGSTQATGAGYAHNVNLSAGLACQPCFRENPAISRQPRGACINPPRARYEDDTPTACALAISTAEVVAAARELWAHCAVVRAAELAGLAQ